MDKTYRCVLLSKWGKTIKEFKEHPGDSIIEFTLKKGSPQYRPVGEMPEVQSVVFNLVYSDNVSKETCVLVYESECSPGKAARIMGGF